MSAWKDLERRICRALGGERRGPTGRQFSDCTDNVPFAVEVKRCQRYQMRGSWIAQARRQSKVEQKPWLLVVATPRERNPIVALDFNTLVSILRDAGLVPEAA